jgi:hypothetical protein
MDSKKFAKVFEDQMRICESLLLKKAGEYATDDERLHNFKVASAIQSRTPVQSLGGMMVKHTTSVFDMIEAGDPTQFQMSLWDEKITDNINYLALLRALVVEAFEKPDTSQAELPFVDKI